MISLSYTTQHCTVQRNADKSGYVSMPEYTNIVSKRCYMQQERWPTYVDILIVKNGKQQTHTYVFIHCVRTHKICSPYFCQGNVLIFTFDRS